MKGPSHSVIQGGGMDLGGQSGGELKGASAFPELCCCCVFGSSMYDKMLWPVLATASRLSQQVETGRLLESAGD
jgi:hypothetical protein